MATKTTNLGLTKIEDNDELSDYPAAQQSNSDKLDAEAEYNRQQINGIYNGRNLIAVLGASDADDCYAKLHTRVQAGNYAGLRIGDYMPVASGSSTVNKGNSMTARLAGIDHGRSFGDTALGHSLWFVIDTPIDMTGSDYAVNTSYIAWATENNNGTEGQPSPYLASNLHKWELEEFLPALPTALQNVLINHRILFESRYSASGTLTDSNSWAWGDAGKVFSLSETEVYGQCVWGTKGWSVGADAQLPLFRSSYERLRGGRATWWLRSVVSGSSSGVCYVAGTGYANRYDATGTWVRPRPCFLVG